MQTKTDPQYIYLTALLTSQLMIFTLDNLQGTPYYKQELRQKANTFLKELERLTREDIPLVWGIKDDNLYQLMDYIKEGLQEFASIRPEDIGILSEIMKKYRENPEDVLAALQIQLVETHP